MSRYEVHQPQVFTDGGPWAEHDQACAVCREKHAVLNLDDGTFLPCWTCQNEGWRLVRGRSRFSRWFLRAVSP